MAAAAGEKAGIGIETMKKWQYRGGGISVTSSGMCIVWRSAAA